MTSLLPPSANLFMFACASQSGGECNCGGNCQTQCSSPAKRMKTCSAGRPSIRCLPPPFSPAISNVIQKALRSYCTEPFDMSGEYIEMKPTPTPTPSIVVESCTSSPIPHPPARSPKRRTSRTANPAHTPRTSATLHPSVHTYPQMPTAYPTQPQSQSQMADILPEDMLQWWGADMNDQSLLQNNFAMSAIDVNAINAIEFGWYDSDIDMSSPSSDSESPLSSAMASPCSSFQALSTPVSEYAYPHQPLPTSCASFLPALMEGVPSYPTPTPMSSPMSSTASTPVMPSTPTEQRWIDLSAVIKTEMAGKCGAMEKFPDSKVTDFKHVIYNLLVESYNQGSGIVEVYQAEDGRMGFTFRDECHPEKKLPELYALHIRHAPLNHENQDSVFIQDLYKYYLRSCLELLSKYFEKVGKYTFVYQAQDTPLFVPGSSLRDAEKRMKLMKTRARMQKKRKF